MTPFVLVFTNISNSAIKIPFKTNTPYEMKSKVNSLVQSKKKILIPVKVSEYIDFKVVDRLISLGIITMKRKDVIETVITMPIKEESDKSKKLQPKVKFEKAKKVDRVVPVIKEKGAE